MGKLNDMNVSNFSPHVLLYSPIQKAYHIETAAEYRNNPKHGYKLVGRYPNYYEARRQFWEFSRRTRKRGHQY